MDYRRWGVGLIWAGCGLGLVAAMARGQVVERHAKQTGPGGKTIERSIRTERGPGYVDRQIDITRPGGAHLSRETVIRTAPGGRPPTGPARGHGYGYPPPRFAPGPAIGVGLIAAPFLSLSFGSPPPPPPPPPIVFVPEPIYAYPAPPVVIAAPAPRYVAVPEPAPAPPVEYDPFADAHGRLRSYHANSRRDGSLTLGHLGDDRAVPALAERLERDGDRDVRVAAAWALGEIGDPRSAVALERAALYDKKQEVRDAANNAYRRLPRPGPVTSGSVEGEPGRLIDAGPPPVPSGGDRGAPILDGPVGSFSPGRPE